MLDRGRRRLDEFDDAEEGWEQPKSRWRFLGAPLRLARHRPLDCAAAVVALGLTALTLTNALWMQKGPHPAPLMTAALPVSPPKETTGSLAPAPPPRPPEVQAERRSENVVKRTRVELLTEIQRELARRGYYESGIDGVYGSRMDAAIREFEQAARLPVTGEPTEALLQALARSKLAKREKPATAGTAGDAAKAAAAQARRVAALQRALTDFGYGQLKLSGVVDDPTRTAIEKFEREQKLPVKGKVSDRLLRELAAVTGRPLE